jgi:hypothetical protein
MRVVSCFAVLATALAGCSEDLGVCDMVAATTVVYAPDGTPFYAGQGLVQYGCAEGVCHSATAVEDARKGAPHGLNFDVRPLTAQSTPGNIVALRDGIAKVRDEKGDMYGEIAGGTMPPGEEGKRPAQVWKLGNGQSAGLPGIDDNTGKATVRNWLACGAPVVSGVKPGEPSDATQISGSVVLDSLNTGTVESTFTAVYASVLAPCAAACHKPGGVYPALDLSSKATSYSALVDKEPAPGACTGKGKLVVANSCETSLLYLKLNANPPCGSQMPQGGPYLASSALDALCSWIKAGAKSD